MRSFRKYSILVLLLLSVLAVSSCGSKYIGWGVIYIEDSEHKLNAGDVVPILQESEIRDVYTIESADSAAGFDLERWKISFHEKEADALAFSDNYSQWADIYAVNLLNGLSIREEADGGSERLYKLREGQQVKIIGRKDELVNIADHDGYWYIVLTEDGTSGYCFDKNLRIYDSKDADAGGASVLNVELLSQFLDKPFRPEYFRDMVRDNMIDLTRFKTNRGIFAYPDEKKIVLSTKEHQVEFDYTSIVQNNSGRFIFEGSSLQIEVRTENRIAAYFNDNNKEYAEVMVYISNMEELIESELERRDLVYQQLAELGSVSSSAYGRITFEENRSFRWSNYKRLIPNVIPENAGENGRITLVYFPATALTDEYNGVLSFAFDDVPGGGLVNFLFELSDLGIKLVYVPQSDIKKGVVEQESTSPLVIFMSGAGE